MGGFLMTTWTCAGAPVGTRARLWGRAVSVPVRGGKGSPTGTFFPPLRFASPRSVRSSMLRGLRVREGPHGYHDDARHGGDPRRGAPGYPALRAGSGGLPVPVRGGAQPLRRRGRALGRARDRARLPRVVGGAPRRGAGARSGRAGGR